MNPKQMHSKYSALSLGINTLHLTHFQWFSYPNEMLFFFHTFFVTISRLLIKKIFLNFEPLWNEK